MQNEESGHANSRLTRQILIAMVSGIAVGLLFYYAAKQEAIVSSGLFNFVDSFFLHGIVDVLGQVFVKSLKVMVVPLVFVSLVCGVASLKEASSIGIISLKTLSLYFFTTAVAISIALILANIFQPGTGLESVQSSAFEPKQSPGLTTVLVNLFPSNIVHAMSQGQMLPIIIFAILFGMAINRTGDEAKPVLLFFMALDKVIMRLVLLIMAMAPYGVFCLMVAMFAATGPEHITKLAAYFFTVIAALLLHGFGTMSILLTVLARLNPWVLFKKVRSIWLFAFSTASSNATLPVTLNVVENQLGVNNRVASFSIPLGATINMDGTAIMQGVATVFVAQIYGIDIGLSGYLMVIATATLASIGTAGVPSVGLITLALVFEQVGLPVEGIALIIGIDRLLDMIRTAVNVTGDTVVSTIVAKSNGDFDEAVYYK